jgi:hypothetical protein
MVNKVALVMSMLASASIARKVARMFYRRRVRDPRACILIRVPEHSVARRLAYTKDTSPS